jgi:hypothetical protein
MPKTKISEYSTTNSANTDIESINIDEGCAPSGINNAIRELMVHLKEFQTGSSGDPLTVAGTFVASGGATLSGTNTLSGSTVMTASAGTSASPSIHFSSDTNTGIFSPAADTIAFAEGGAEAMRIDSSGNVGIGTTSPKSIASGYQSLDVRGSTGGGFYFGPSGASNYSLLYASASGTDFGTTAAAPLRFYTSDAERARITSDGEFLIGATATPVGAGATKFYCAQGAADYSGYFGSTSGTAANNYGLRVKYLNASPNGTGNTFLSCDDSTALRAEIRSNGGLANYSANNVNLASDERLKKDISPLSSTWSKVKDIEVVNFRYKDCNEGDPALYGVIAQQIQPIVPELVVVTREVQEAVEAKEAVLDEEGNVVEPAVEAKEATPEYFGIREQPMYWLAIKALQEAMARIETLEAQNAAFEARLAALEAK